MNDFIDDLHDVFTGRDREFGEELRALLLSLWRKGYAQGHAKAKAELNQELADAKKLFERGLQEVQVKADKVLERRRGLVRDIKLDHGVLRLDLMPGAEVVLQRLFEEHVKQVNGRASDQDFDVHWNGSQVSIMPPTQPRAAADPASPYGRGKQVDGGCSDCGGRGIGDYPFACHSCGGTGEASGGKGPGGYDRY